jgi:LuxR family maltose regulon positive regulatory protein
MMNDRHLYRRMRHYNKLMPAVILSTKLYIPPPRPGIVSRQRLVEQLNNGLTAGRSPGMALISASAGSGKTTLVSEWIAGCKRPVAWLSLDDGDNDLTRFLTYIVAALQTISANIGARMLALLQSPQPPLMESLLTELLNEISAIPNDFILVLDDYHVIDSRLVNQALTFLVEHQPPQMYLVIATREDPTLPLACLRVRGHLTELRAVDLRFTSDEAADFLNRRMGLELSDEDIASLEICTEGWIAGLQLAAISMHGHKDKTSFLKSFSGSHHFVMDYLLEEVLQHQSENVQTFLLRTSILDRMCGPLCDAVLGTPSASGQETLEFLKRANLFIVPLDNERRWYRYHHLFSEFLQKRQAQNDTTGIIIEDHIRASDWYENNGLMIEAFRHAAAGKDIGRAERLIFSDVMDLHFSGVVSTVLDWVNNLPPDVLDARPSLRVRSATLALMTGQTSGVEEKLQAAERMLPNPEQDQQTRDLIGQIACARATLALTRYDTQSMHTQARRAMEYLDPANLSFLFTANWALASADFLQGNRAGAARACQEAIAISQKSGSVFSKILSNYVLSQLQVQDNHLFQAVETYRDLLQLTNCHPQPLSCEFHLGLAKIFYEWNDLEAADQHGRQSQELSRLYDRQIDRFIICDVFMARLKLERGDVEGAAKTLEEAHQTAIQKNFSMRLHEIAAGLVPVLIQKKQLATAAHLAKLFELPLCQARVLIAQHNPSGALVLLEAFRRQMEARCWVDQVIKTLPLQAIALYQLGELDKSLLVLDDALSLAEKGGFIRLFVDEDAPMLELLSVGAARGIRPVYFDKLLTAFKVEKMDERPKTTMSGRSPLVEGLSPRELQILYLIAQGLSNQEICAKLYIALDTVKGHNRRIFNKLKVERRTEAIARGKELGLL